MLSIGSNGDASFERDLLGHGPECKVDIMDGTLSPTKTAMLNGLPAAITFRPQNFVADTWKAYGSWHQQAGRQTAAPSLRLLKIDCEVRAFSNAWPPSCSCCRASNVCA